MKKMSLIIVIMTSLFMKSALSQDALTYSAAVEKSETSTATAPLPVFNFSGYSYDYELKNITREMAGEHPFGDEIAKKDYLLDEKYKSEVALIPGNPQTRTVIQKPEIYDAVRRIEKHLKKSVKKGELTLDSATYTYNKVLDVALSIKNADTKNFEDAVSRAESEAAKIELFTKRVNLIY